MEGLLFCGMLVRSTATLLLIQPPTTTPKEEEDGPRVCAPLDIRMDFWLLVVRAARRVNLQVEDLCCSAFIKFLKIYVSYEKTI